MNLQLDPPIVVKAECLAAVRLWRDAAVFQKFRHLGSSDSRHGLLLGPLWKLLKANDTALWSGKHKGGLKAAFTDRQWPQDRCWTAGWTEHDRCMLCVESATTTRVARQRQATMQAPSLAHAHVASAPALMIRPSDDSLPSDGTSPANSGDGPSEANHADIASALVGTLVHRVCFCPHHSDERARSNVRAPAEAPTDGDPIPDALLAAISSGVYPQPKLSLAPHNRAPVQGSFQ